MVSYGERASMNLALITARGGSKRIPGKNVREFLGKPIIYYSIAAARNARCFDEIMVSTDSIEIASVAREYGAVVPFMRSTKNSDDTATTADVILEVLNEYRKIGKEFDVVCCIYPTAPFINSELLRDAAEYLGQKNSIDAVIPVVRFSYPPQRGLIIRNNRLEMSMPQYTSVRSQDLEPIYHDAGQFYMLKTEYFVNSKSLWNGNICPIVLSEMVVQDIDSQEDWNLAEMKYQLMLDRGKDDAK